jgi:hypothetical protein
MFLENYSFLEAQGSGGVTDYIWPIKLASYLGETSSIVNEGIATLKTVNAYRKSPRTQLQKAFPGYYKGSSKAVTNSMKTLNITKAVGQGLARPFFFVGVGLSTVDVVMDHSASNIALNIAPVSAKLTGWNVG